MTTLIAFLVTLAVLVLVHEWGHYRVARACDVKVLRFSVGFGRVLWSRQRGETEWVISLLPLGGYVRMLDEREGEVPASELHRAFNRKSLAQRAAIVSAGPLANLLLAVLLYAAASWIGTDEPVAQIGTPLAGSVADRAGLQAGDRISAFSSDGQNWEPLESMSDLRWRLTQAVLERHDLWLLREARAHQGGSSVQLDLDTLDLREGGESALMKHIGLIAPYSEPVLGRITNNGPADQAGLQAGDRVLQVDGQPVADAAALRMMIRRVVSATAMHWQIDRQGRVLSVAVEPRQISDERGVTVGRIDAVIGRGPELVRVSHGLFEGLRLGVVRTWDSSMLSLRMLGRMLVGQASVRNLSGPLAIADYAGQSAQLGLAYYLGFLAIVSVSLGVLNLLPLPVLDGGHLVYYFVEAVMGRPIPVIWTERLQRGGLVLLLAMMSIALYNDVARMLGQP